MSHEPDFTDPIHEMNELSRELEPERDLWPGIAMQIHAHRAEMKRRSERWKFAGVAAALAIVVGAVAWRMGSEAPIETPRLVATPGREAPGDVSRHPSTLAAYAESDRTLATIRDDLRRSIDAHQERLPPETRALVFENLRTIDRAIAEIEVALEGAPASSELARTYIAYREREIDLLRQANRLVSRL